MSLRRSPVVSERRGDVVYTPDWVAADMVKHFNPKGSILDPCRGAGAFTKRMPGCLFWCEITDGADFFEWSRCVDWMVGNPPYSLTRKWFRHSYKYAEQFVYLVPLRNVYSGAGFIREIYEYGGIVETRHYGGGARLGFPMGNAIGALHVARGYKGPMTTTFAEAP